METEPRPQRAQHTPSELAILSRWTPGMLSFNGWRYLGQDEHTGEMLWVDPIAEGATVHRLFPHDAGSFVPDRSDLVTAAYLAQREAQTGKRVLHRRLG